MNGFYVFAMVLLYLLIIFIQSEIWGLQKENDAIYYDYMKLLERIDKLESESANIQIYKPSGEKTEGTERLSN